MTSAGHGEGIGCSARTTPVEGVGDEAAARLHVPARRPFFLRAFLRALYDRATYDARRNVGLWLGFAIAIPIPVLSLTSSSPPWIDVISLTAPGLFAVILGAAVRVSGLGEAEIRRVVSEASTAGRAGAAERDVLRGAAGTERTERERLEALRRLMDADLELAERVNRSLLPKDIVRPGVEVVVRQVPCSFVGGDYLLAALPRPDLLYLCVGDVSGHGVSAALVVSRIHGLVQGLVLEQRAPEQILEEIGRATTLILEGTPLFLTFAVFRADLAARRIDYATAGHPAQFLLRSDGSVESLVTENGILGSSVAPATGRMRSGSAPYGSGDTLVLFTDGLFEVLARAGDVMWGEAGLLSNLGRLAKSPPTAVAAEILRTVIEYGRVGPFKDDVSLMVARFGPPASAG